MDEDWVAFLERKRDHYRSSIELLRAGRIGTSERTDGELVDTTERTIKDQEHWLSEIENLLTPRTKEVGG